MSFKPHCNLLKRWKWYNINRKKQIMKLYHKRSPNYWKDKIKEIKE